jgi:hypothetical protein
LCRDSNQFDVPLTALAEIDFGGALREELHFIEWGERGSPFGFDKFLDMDIESPEIDAMSAIQLESRIRRSQ